MVDKALLSFCTRAQTDLTSSPRENRDTRQIEVSARPNFAISAVSICWEHMLLRRCSRVVCAAPVSAHRHQVRNVPPGKTNIVICPLERSYNVCYRLGYIGWTGCFVNTYISTNGGLIHGATFGGMETTSSV